MLKLFKPIFVGLLAFFCISAPAFAWPFVYPTGVTVYSPKKSFNCYTLFSPMELELKGQSAPTPKSEYFVYLINMSGEVVHRWTLPDPPLASKLLPNGHLVVSLMSREKQPGRPGVGTFWLGGYTGVILELDWDGKTVFQYKDLSMHHEFVRRPNGNIIYMGWEQVPKKLQAKVLGGLQGTEQGGGVMWNDYLVEINPQGKRVWTWHANQHLDPKIDIIGLLYNRNEWCHANAIDILDNGNILLTSRSLDSLLVIDPKSGRIVQRWGSASFLDPKTGVIEHRKGPKVLEGPHDARQIPDGLPGAGRITVYDNRANTGDFLFSQVVEVDLASGKVVKQAPPPLGRKHLSDFLGGAQKLPNGNNLVCDGSNGRLFQETPEGQVSWEYISPFVPMPQLQGVIFKANAYAPDYCPQFKNLPPAEGAPVVMSDKSKPNEDESKPNESGNEAPPEPQAPAQLNYFSPSTLIALVVALLASLLLNIFLWRQEKRR